MFTQKKYFFIPSNFDIQSFCNTNKLPLYKVAYIIDLFIRKPKDYLIQRAIPLNSTILKNKLGSNYNSIVECLIVNGIIENTKGYTIGKKSREYQLSDCYYNWNYITHLKNDSEGLNEKLKLKQEKTHKIKFIEDQKLPKLERSVKMPSEKFYEVYSPLINFFNEKLSIDKLEADKIVNNLISMNYSPDKIKNYLAILKSIELGDYNLKCDLNMRFYSVITSLPRKFRKILRYNDEELIGIDVSNTQPLLINKLLDKMFLNKLVRSKNLEVDDLKFSLLIKEIQSNTKEIENYKRLTTSGRFYEFFMEKSKILDRNIVKENVIKIINDNGINNTHEKKIIRETMLKYFPTVHLLLDTIKSRNYKYSSYILMTMEAQNFVIDLPLNFYYYEENKNIPLFTIHDCFITTKSNINLLKDFLQTYLTELLGTNPNLKIDDFNEKGHFK